MKPRQLGKGERISLLLREGKEESGIRNEFVREYGWVLWHNDYEGKHTRTRYQIKSVPGSYDPFYQIMEISYQIVHKPVGIQSSWDLSTLQTIPLLPIFPSPPTMAKSLFSIPIFFIVFRETLEAAIIISVLLGLAEQIVSRDPNFIQRTEESRTPGEEDGAINELVVVDDAVQRRRLLRKMRIQVI